ncbi:SDR family NAD(P)-dependent oxidoreductase [uncultured Albimonas sp.]|uniref:SDR family NAD(P)-dependent oxidoreductase n=1 Tax=uncultured Albimonas sp. TaxID=1331701 RepID=UPI0030EB7E99|tara:strand:+ start:2660 stop:3346 length:687 start_codon:yes stop_codon:yes gene_type:complete
MQDLKGQAALVTGASRGLGRAFAETLGARGAEVIAVARTVGALEELDDAIRAAGGPQATLVPLDITDDPALERLGAAIHGRWGKLDLWIHAAVNDPPLAPAEHATDKDWDKAMAVNARATQRLIRSLDPLLRLAPAGGRAVFFDDRHNGGAFHGAYAASKAAARAITTAWAVETTRFPLTVLHLSPPPMPSGLRARFRPGEDRATLTPAREVAAEMMSEALGDSAARA